MKASARVLACSAQECDEEAGEREADDVGEGVGGPGRAARGHHLVLADDAWQDGDLGGPEEEADRGDQEDQRIHEHDVDARDIGDGHDQSGTDEVARNKYALVLPAIDEGARDGAE